MLNQVADQQKLNVLEIPTHKPIQKARCADIHKEKKKKLNVLIINQKHIYFRFCNKKVLFLFD